MKPKKQQFWNGVVSTLALLLTATGEVKGTTQCASSNTLQP